MEEPLLLFNGAKLVRAQISTQVGALYKRVYMSAQKVKKVCTHRTANRMSFHT